jgi:CSLREA domain-containing protein
MTSLKSLSAPNLRHTLKRFSAVLAAFLVVGVLAAAFFYVSTRAAGTTYYSRANALPPESVASWSTTRDGLGAPPPSFAGAGDAFVIQNTHNLSTLTAWPVTGSNSKLEIESGGTLTANNAVTLAGTTTFQIDGGGTYVHNNATAFGSTIFNGTESFAPTSTVILNNSNTTGPSGVAFGNLTINFTTDPGGFVNCGGGLTTVNGNLSIISTSTREFRLAANTNYTLAVGGNIIVQGGTLNLANGTGTPAINLGGNFNQTGGTFTQSGANASTITFTGGMPFVTFTQSAGTFDDTNINWLIANSKTVQFNNAFTNAASRTFTISPGGLLLAAAPITNSGALNVNGEFRITDGGDASGNNFVYDPAGTLGFLTASTFNVGGTPAYWPTAATGPKNVNVLTGGITMNVARTVNTLFETSAPITNANNLTLPGTCRLDGGGASFTGTPVYGAGSALTYDTGGTFNAGAEFPASGAANVSLNSTTLLNLDGDKSISGTMSVGANTVGPNAATPFSLTAPTITLTTGTLNVNNLNVASTLGASVAGTVNVNGNWNVANFNGPASTVNFNGAGAQSVNTATVFRNVNLNNDLNLAAGVVVNGTLALGSRKIATNANAVEIGTTGVVTRAGGYVLGTILKDFAAPGPSDFTFDVGTSNGYTPVNANATTGAGSLSVNATQTKHPNIVGTNALARFWTLSGSGITTNLTFNYLAGDVFVTAPVTEANYKVMKFSGGNFTQPAAQSVNAAAHTATVNGVSSFSDWTLAARTAASTVYVDDNFTGPGGTDPDGAGPATEIGYDAFKTIQEGVNAVAAGGTVNVYAGTYDEDVLINNAGLSLLGIDAGTKTIRGAIGGDATTVHILSSNVTVAGFTITRLGNNTTDWNNAGLNGAGIAIQGTSITNTLIRDNVITGNRTGIDINNSNGHTVRNNSITDNRTGLIFRNQTDQMTVVENFITNNWTVGVLFLDGSGGTNIPVQSARHSTFSNNDLSGNWYGQIVDRQSGGSIPAPGTTNLKNFRGNWYGTTSPVVTTANSAEPGYAAQIPVEFGGTATPPGGQPDIAGPASANFKYTPFLLSGTDTNVETTPGRGTNGFQGVQNSSVVTPANQQGWVFFDDNNGVGTGSGGFENGPSTPPLGVGSAFLQVDSIARHALGTAAYAGTRMDDITGLGYYSYQNNNVNTVVAISLQFDIDYDLNDTNNTFQGRLVFEPYQTPANVQQNVWQNWDALAGKWYGTRTTVPVNNVNVPNPCQQDTPCTWQQVLASFPNAGVRNTPFSAVLFKAGGPWSPGFRGNVDDFRITVNTAQTTYDFEPLPSLSINDVTHAEGGSGTTAYTFTVTLSRVFDQTVTVNYATADDSATSPSDYASASGTLTFAPGETTKQLTVQVKGERLFEPDEQFFVNLSNPSNATVADPQGVGTITNDDVPPPAVVYVDDDWANVSPGADPDGPGPATDFGYDSFATVQGGVDGVAANGTVIVHAGSYPEQVTISKSLMLSGAGQASTFINTPASLAPRIGGNLVLLQVDSAATVDVSGITVAGPRVFNGCSAQIFYGVFVAGAANLNLHDAAVRDIRMADPSLFGCQDGNAVRAGSQGLGQTATLTANNLTLTGYQKTGIIVDGAGTTATITNSTLTGFGPENLAQNAIQIGRGAGATVTGNTITGSECNNPVCGPDPFTDAFGTGLLIFSTGAPVNVSNNTISNNDTGVYNNAANTTISGNTMAGNRFEAIFLDEGNAAVSNNTISGASNAGVTAVSYVGNAGNSNGTLDHNTITGATTGLQMLDDTSGPDAFVPQLTAHFNRIVATTTAIDNPQSKTADLENNWWGCNNGPGNTGCGAVTGTGADFDPWFVLLASATPDSILPGGTSNVAADMTHNSAGVVPAGTLPDLPASFTATNGTMTPTSATVHNGAANSTFTSTNASNAVATVTVDNQNVNVPITVNAPSFSIDDVTHAEGDSGTTEYTFTVTKTGATNLAASVNFATADDTATVADGDYASNSGTLSFAANETTKQLTVLVNGDIKFETDEQFFVNLSYAVNATVADPQGVGAITNEDPVPALSIGDVTLSEGNTGLTNFVFHVTKSGATSQSASVQFATADGTATVADGDYDPKSGTLTFAANETDKTITVAVHGDTIYEANENFFVNLTAPSSATVTDAQGVGTITNDDKPPATLVVNTTDDNDDGFCLADHCSLREAIKAANVNIDANTINFAIPATDAGRNATTGVYTITPASALPTVVRRVTIDGYSQTPCASNPAPCSKPNTLAVGDDAVLLIELNGTNAGAGGGINGLIITGGNTTVSGLVVNRFGGHGIVLQTNSSDAITGNFIGTDAAGTAARDNGGSGVIVFNSSGNTIGGTTPASRNVISANGANGVQLTGSNTVQGNYIGTDATGSVDLGNAGGGVVSVSGFSHVIGGAGVGAGNLISGNDGDGVFFISGNSILVQGNLIGTKADGVTALGNGGNGVTFSGGGSLFNTVGGISAGEANTIAFNGGDGIHIDATAGIAHTLRGNSVYSNGTTTAHLGIDLDADGVTPNDPKDADTGANNLQNFPVITSALVTGSTRTIMGTLNSTPNQSFEIDFYANAACDGSGSGEGQTYIGSLTTDTTDANGDVSFTFHPASLAAGQFVTATATDASGNTSEFSECAAATVGASGSIQFTAASYEVSESGGTASITVTRAGGTDGLITSYFSTADGTATAPADYDAVSSQAITFADGESGTKTVGVNINQDFLVEGDETVALSLSATTVNRIGKGATRTAINVGTSATLIIHDDEPPPSISIGDALVSEPQSGTSNATFTVTLSAAAEYAISVNYATADGTATAASGDYDSTSDTLTFAPGETTQAINVPVHADALAEGKETFTVNLSNPNPALAITDGTGQGTIVDPVLNGQIIISEFRFHGANGAQDEFVELYNNTNTDITVATDDGSDGWAIAAITSDGMNVDLLRTIPNGKIIPARSHYLITDEPGSFSSARVSRGVKRSVTAPPGYSLNVEGDLPYDCDIDDGAGVAIFRTAEPGSFALNTRLDAAGFSTLQTPLADLFREGAGLTSPGSVDGEYSFVRSLVTGFPRDTNDNATDFTFVATDGEVYGSVPATLGAPGPENSASPTLSTSKVKPTVVDPGCTGTSNTPGDACSRYRDTTAGNPSTSQFGTLSFRRTFTNTTSQAVTRLRFRVIDVTTRAGGAEPAPGTADLRGLTSQTFTATKTGGGTVLITGLTLEEPPTQTIGGGLNSTLASDMITLASPLAPGGSINVEFRFGVKQSGGFRAFVIVEAVLDGSTASPAQKRGAAKVGAPIKIK